MRKELMGMLIVALVCFGAFAADDIVVERVIGSNFPGEYKHPCTITELDNGDLYISYYGGTGEYQDDSKVWGIRKVKGTDEWTAPEVLADTPFRGEGNPVIFQAPDGLVWLFYVQRYGDTWSDSRVKAKVSEDGAKTWSDSIMLTFEKGTMVQTRPIVLNNGDYLLPAYKETGHDREIVGADTCSFFIRINPKTKEISYTNLIASKYGNLQPNAVQITDDYLVSYARRAGGYDPLDDGMIVRSESRDGGKTWSKGTNTIFPNPNAAVTLIRLQNGHLFLAYNDNPGDRNPLAGAISTDGEKSWGFKRILLSSDTPQSFAYPVAMQSKDGKIHLVCTTDVRKTILHLTFDEEAILSHTWER